MKGAIKELSEIIATVTRLIGYVLLVLRACDVVDWPWYMVLLPQFVAIGLHLFFEIVVAIVDDDD